MYCPHCGGMLRSPRVCHHCGRKLLQKLAEPAPVVDQRNDALAGKAGVGWGARHWVGAVLGGLLAIWLGADFLQYPAPATSDGQVAPHRQSKLRPVLRGEKYIAAVKSSVLASQRARPIGAAFEKAFADYQWTTGESSRGIPFVEFSGRNIEAYRQLKLDQEKRCGNKIPGKECQDAAALSFAKFRFVLSDRGNVATIYEFEWPMFDEWTNPLELALNYIYK